MNLIVKKILNPSYISQRRGSSLFSKNLVFFLKSALKESFVCYVKRKVPRHNTYNKWGKNKLQNNIYEYIYVK